MHNTRIIHRTRTAAVFRDIPTELSLITDDTNYLKAFKSLKVDTFRIPFVPARDA